MLHFKRNPRRIQSEINIQVHVYDPITWSIASQSQRAQKLIMTIDSIESVLFLFSDLVGLFYLGIWLPVLLCDQIQISSVNIEESHCQKTVLSEIFPLWKGEAISIGTEGLYIAFPLQYLLCSKGKLVLPLVESFKNFFWQSIDFED